MQIVRHQDVYRFAINVEPLLLQKEAENCFLLGTIHRLKSQVTPINPDVLMFSVESDGEAIGAAIQTDPIGMFVSELSGDRAVERIVAKLREIDWPGRGFIAPVATADALAKSWDERARQAMKPVRDLRVFQLTSIIPPVPIGGRLLEGSCEELSLLASWVDAYCREINEPASDPHGLARRLLDEKRIFFWKYDRFRSMTAITGPTPNGIRINFVYTPPEDRGCGYASNLVAAVSQRMLDAGRARCFLNTDLFNPTSNKIYQQIGYEPVCDFRHWVFCD